MEDTSAEETGAADDGAEDAGTDDETASEDSKEPVACRLSIQESESFPPFPQEARTTEKQAAAASMQTAARRFRGSFPAVFPEGVFGFRFGLRILQRPFLLRLSIRVFAGQKENPGAAASDKAAADRGRQLFFPRFPWGYPEKSANLYLRAKAGGYRPQFFFNIR